MSKNKIILITLLSLIESNALSDTIFTYQNQDNETLFMTLINELVCSEEDMDNLMYAIGEGDQEDLINNLKDILSKEQ